VARAAGIGAARAAAVRTSCASPGEVDRLSHLDRLRVERVSFVPQLSVRFISRRSTSRWRGGGSGATRGSGDAGSVCPGLRRPVDSPVPGVAARIGGDEGIAPVEPCGWSSRNSCIGSGTPHLSG